MLQPILHHLKGKRVVLASGSPRRQEIIKQLVNKIQSINTFSYKTFIIILGIRCRVMSIHIWGKPETRRLWIIRRVCRRDSPPKGLGSRQTTTICRSTSRSRYWRRHNGGIGFKNIRQTKNKRRCIPNVIRVSNSKQCGMFPSVTLKFLSID